MLKHNSVQHTALLTFMLCDDSSDFELDQYAQECIIALDVGEVFNGTKFRVLRYADEYIVTGLGFKSCKTPDDVFKYINSFTAK